MYVEGLSFLKYRVNPEPILLKIELFEAQTVQLLFQMYLDSNGYTSILSEPNRQGYRHQSLPPIAIIAYLFSEALRSDPCRLDIHRTKSYNRYKTGEEKRRE